jgi:hypothetical protein
MNFDKKVYYLKRERTKLKYLCISAEPVSFVQRLFYFAKTGDNNLKTKKKRETNRTTTRNNSKV